MMREYSGIKPNLYKRYMDDVAGSGVMHRTRANTVPGFRSKFPSQKLSTYGLASSLKLLFLDMYLVPRDDRISA